jgi:hypothetical protein
VMLGPLQWKPQSVTHRRLCHGPHGCILLAVSQSCPLWWRVTYNPFVECVSLCIEYVFLKAVHPFISPNVKQTFMHVHSLPRYGTRAQGGYWW